MAEGPAKGCDPACGITWGHEGTVHTGECIPVSVVLETLRARVEMAQSKLDEALSEKDARIRDLKAKLYDEMTKEDEDRY